MSVMTRDEMISAAKEVNKDTLDAHLASCRPEIAALKKELRELHEQIDTTVVEYSRDRFASVELILAFPLRYGAHKLCETCGEFDCFGDHEKTPRSWWEER